MNFNCPQCDKSLFRYNGHNTYTTPCDDCHKPLEIDTGIIVNIVNRTELQQLNEIINIYEYNPYLDFTKNVWDVYYKFLKRIAITHYFIICHGEAVRYHKTPEEPFVTFEEWKLLKSVDPEVKYYHINAHRCSIPNYQPNYKNK